MPTPHPARNMILARMPMRTAARSCGISYTHFTRVLSGHAPASPRFRARVSELLSVPEDVCFLSPYQQAVASDPALQTLQARLEAVNMDPAAITAIQQAVLAVAQPRRAEHV